MLTPERVECHELLDEHDAPRADMERSLRDLWRINRWLGGVGIYNRLLRRFEAASVLDVGAGTCEVVNTAPARLRIGLDQKIEHLLYRRESTRGVHRVAGEALNLPFRDGAVDAVTSAHFFHHFSPDENARILAESLRVARRGVAVNDTRRHYLPLLFVQLVAALRLVGRITRFDAPASVRQGYTTGEARAIAERVPAARHELVSAWPFRFGIVLWK
ncbi:MAG TPA: methyltransferase domain-containing protein [Thermoanaerobaculia bacterium]|nr:methyltransferase domain-containing protein [Thermoanaerobaculia bacterium]